MTDTRRTGLSPDAQAPYAHLTPHHLLDAIAAAGFPVTGGMLQLNSYENRVVQLALEDGSAVVAKFYRPARWTDAQILEEHQFTLELAAADLPVAAPIPLVPPQEDPALVVSTDPPTLGRWRVRDEDAAAPEGIHEATYRFAVAPRRAGRAPELENPQTLAWIGRLLGRLHNIGATATFQHRRTLDVDTFGWQARDRVERSDALGPGAEAAVWLDTSARALKAVERAFAAAGSIAHLRLHGDCHPGNILWREEGESAGPLFVDLDDACTGPAMQDLWMLLSGDRESMRSQLHHVLEGYRVFRRFDAAELALIEPLRTLRMVHHSAWLAERWSDPAFPSAFPWFGSPAYWNQQVTQLREQIESMEEAPLDGV
jgi:Ser/Thr protein kinase RdoA (MazF antagonist)